jgi:hypothetical protein
MIIFNPRNRSFTDSIIVTYTIMFRASLMGYRPVGESQMKRESQRQCRSRSLCLIYGASTLLIVILIYSLIQNAGFTKCSRLDFWLSGKCEAEAEHLLYGEFGLRTINSPQDSRPDPGFALSLYDEALYLTEISPSLYLSTRAHEKPELYGVSMYHQLHCLDALQGKILGKPMKEHYDTNHLIHCIDYISQVSVWSLS